MIVPDWPVPPGVRSLLSLREGGVSRAPFDSLNLGDHVGDDPVAVAENRRRYAAALAAHPVFLRQVHGMQAARLDRDSTDGIEADACWTREPGVACTIMVADCLPVLLADREARAVAAAHCGWRGLAGQDGRGVLEALWESFWPQLAASPAEAAPRTLAWLGPCIGPGAFEVGAEVKDAFEAASPGASMRFRPAPSGKWLADLPGLARDRLRALDITRLYGNDGSADWCTVSDSSRFFSHRRDRISGRFAASIWLG